MKRILEAEAMDDKDEALAYDALNAYGQGDLLHECFSTSVLNLGIQKGKILDIGTGTGSIPVKIALRNKHLQITGIDLSSSMLDIAREKSIKNGVSHQIEFVRVNANSIPYEDNYFDMVISHVTLHHIPDPVPILKEAFRVLKPEGGLLIRDLKRPKSKLFLNMYTKLLGKEFNVIQKKLFRKSFMAGFTIKEFTKMMIEAGGAGCNIEKYFFTHIGIIKKPMNLREGVKHNINKPLSFSEKILSQFYISK